MTEPTRDALHAETLVMLAAYDQQTTRTDEQQCLAYAAECVKRVPELEALAEFRRCELEAVRIENLGVRAENRRLEAEVERLRGALDKLADTWDADSGNESKVIALRKLARRAGRPPHPED